MAGPKKLIEGRDDRRADPTRFWSAKGPELVFSWQMPQNMRSGEQFVVTRASTGRTQTTGITTRGPDDPSRVGWDRQTGSDPGVAGHAFYDPPQPGSNPGCCQGLTGRACHIRSCVLGWSYNLRFEIYGLSISYKPYDPDRVGPATAHNSGPTQVIRKQHCGESTGHFGFTLC